MLERRERTWSRRPVDFDNGGRNTVAARANRASLPHPFLLFILGLRTPRVCVRPHANGADRAAGRARHHRCERGARGVDGAGRVPTRSGGSKRTCDGKSGLSRCRGLRPTRCPAARAGRGD